MGGAQGSVVELGELELQARLAADRHDKRREVRAYPLGLVAAIEAGRISAQDAYSGVVFGGPAFWEQFDEQRA